MASMVGGGGRRTSGIEQSEELRGLTRRLYEIFNESDPDVLGDIFSSDPSFLVIGTDPEEWWIDHDEYCQVLNTQIEEGAFGFRPGDIQAWVDGRVGWVADRPTVLLRDGSELIVRMTAVFILDRGHWTVVQLHISFGVDNEDVFGKSLTISLETLAASVELERPDVATIAAPDGTVTVVFTDIECSTEMAEQMGDRKWMDLLRWHDRLLHETAQRHGGFVVKSQGDGFMLAFSSASRALDFASAAQEAITPGYDGQKVRIRVGINTGEAIRERDDFYGRAVILAARVASEATGGEVFVSDLVARLVAGVDRFRFGAPRSVELKGLSGMHTLYPLLLDN
jgi:class 3 adenylate cyclase